MSEGAEKSSETFDEFAEAYDSALTEGISISGEDKYYFAEERIAWLARALNQRPGKVSLIIDFGCGTGTSIPYLIKCFDPTTVIGVDVSAKSLEIARLQCKFRNVEFCLIENLRLAEQADLVFCNGVVHHISPSDRKNVIRRVYGYLRSGGVFSLWENNPWNPGTHYVMSRIPFDREAIKVSPIEARNLLRSIGFSVIRTDYLFVFPRALRFLRKLEPYLSSFPFGAQYHVLSHKLSLK